MIAAIIIVTLLAIIAAKSRAVGAAMLLGIVAVVLLGVQAPDFMAGVGQVLAAVAGGVADGVSAAAE